MEKGPRKSSGEHVTRNLVAEWDGMDAATRLQVVMENRHLFRVMRLIDGREFAMIEKKLEKMHPSNREYVVKRVEHLFGNINLQETIAGQATEICRNNLKAALVAIPGN